MLNWWSVFKINHVSWWNFEHPCHCWKWSSPLEMHRLWQISTQTVYIRLCISDIHCRLISSKQTVNIYNVNHKKGGSTFVIITWKVSDQFFIIFYPNVTTLRSGLCCRNSVCLSSVCLSVCNVGAPYSGGWSFRQNFFTAVYAGHPLTSVQNFCGDSPRGTPPSVAINARGVSK